MFISIILIGLLGLGAVTGTFVAGALAVKRANNKKNQVVAGISTGAPSNWTGSHKPEAKLHRRLRDAVAALAASAGDDVAMQPLRQQIEADAAALDQQLVATAHLSSPHKEQALGDLSEAVEKLEEIASEAVRRGIRNSGRSVEDQLDDLSVRLESMRLARHEVDEADQSGQQG